jgi:hypothetical protein
MALANDRDFPVLSAVVVARWSVAEAMAFARFTATVCSVEA